MSELFLLIKSLEKQKNQELRHPGCRQNVTNKNTLDRFSLLFDNTFHLFHPFLGGVHLPSMNTFIHAHAAYVNKFFKKNQSDGVGDNETDGVMSFARR